MIGTKKYSGIGFYHPLLSVNNYNKRALNAHVINSQSEIYPRLTPIYVRSLPISVNDYLSMYNSATIRRRPSSSSFRGEDALGGKPSPRHITPGWAAESQTVLFMLLT